MTLIFRQYTVKGDCILAAGVKEIDVADEAEKARIIDLMGSEGWLLEAVF